MRWLIAFGIIAGCRGNDKDVPRRSEATTGSAVAQPHTTGPFVAAPVTPALDHDAAPVLPETTNAAVAFDRQSRDDAWASETERDLRQKLTKVHGRLEAAECRHTICRVTVRGSSAEIRGAIDDLERSLQSSARSMLLTNPVERDDGTVELRAFVDYDR